MNNATDMVLHLLSNENCVDETVSRNIIDAGDVCQFGLGMDEFSFDKFVKRDRSCFT